MPQRHRVVFLERDSIPVPLRQIAFDHQWIDYTATVPSQVLERLRGATIAIANKLPLDATTLGHRGGR